MRSYQRFSCSAFAAAWLLGGIVVAVLAPSVLRAQTVALDGGLSDAWRDELNSQLDQQLAALTSVAARKPATAAAQMRAKERDFTFQLNASGALMPARREPWLPAVASILGEHGLPASLMGVAAVESGFNPEALSPKGARGLWQLMPETARRYGLAVEPGRDERLDPVKSTHAAARYLVDLYAQFQDWPLTLAAYNAGEKRVERALEKRGAGDFWTLSRLAALPQETRRYVPSVLAKVERVAFPIRAVPKAAPADQDSSPGRVVYATSAPPGSATR
jgi:soluble lytic murein transglycosylase-like protein